MILGGAHSPQSRKYITLYWVGHTLLNHVNILRYMSADKQSAEWLYGARVKVYFMKDVDFGVNLGPFQEKLTLKLWLFEHEIANI